MTRFGEDPDARCVICGEPEHRDADGMVERCEWYNFDVERIEPVYLRDIGPCPSLGPFSERVAART